MGMQHEHPCCVMVGLNLLSVFSVVLLLLEGHGTHTAVVHSMTEPATKPLRG